MRGDGGEGCIRNFILEIIHVEHIGGDGRIGEFAVRREGAVKIGSGGDADTVTFTEVDVVGLTFSIATPTQSPEKQKDKPPEQSKPPEQEEVIKFKSKDFTLGQAADDAQLTQMLATDDKLEIALRRLGSYVYESRTGD